MPIVPLPRFEAEADPKARGLSEEELRTYSRLAPPETVVVKYGQAGMIGEFPARLDRVPGCGTKFVVKTPRGLEIGEMLTTTCSNGGCGKSIARREMLDYIDNSGGKQYPFTTSGRVLRIAAIEDLQHMERLKELKRPMLKRVREIVVEQQLSMKVVDIEPILGEEVLTVYFMSENRIDFRDLVHLLSEEFHSRVELRQIGAREEARFTADYERCGQHCCCQQFLKVLKPVSMKSAKVQKGTLDPLKISGRCGRLMCCLRYEDQTYADLKKNLPHRKTRVGTPDGVGIVIDSQILTQLVLVELDADRTRIAVPLEQLCDPDAVPPPRPVQDSPPPSRDSRRGDRRGRNAPTEDPLRGMSEQQVADRVAGAAQRSGGTPSDRPLPRQQRHRDRDRKPPVTQQAAGETGTEPRVEPGIDQPTPADGTSGDQQPRRKKRGRRRGRRPDRAGQNPALPGGSSPTGGGTGDAAGPAPSGTGGQGEGDGQKRKRRRRGGRKRRHKGGGEGGPAGPSEGG